VTPPLGTRGPALAASTIPPLSVQPEEEEEEEEEERTDMFQVIYETFFQIVEDSDVLVPEDENFLSQPSRAGQASCLLV